MHCVLHVIIDENIIKFHHALLFSNTHIRLVYSPDPKHVNVITIFYGD